MVKTHMIGVAILTTTLLAGCISQETVPKSERSLEYTVETGMPAAEAYEVSEEWLVSTFVSSKDVIQLRDEEDHKLIGRGTAKVTYSFAPVDTSFLLTIEHRDGRARMTFDQLQTVTAELGRTSLTNQGQIEAFRKDVAEPMRSDWKAAFGATEDEDW